ncbi:MAG: DUF3224 domain-containing protein [Dehalococcoidia bacterium]
MRATATFEITGWDQTVYDEPPDGPPLARATVYKTFSGDIVGTSTAEVLLCQADDGRGYLASERVVGRIGDRAGAFVIQHGGIQDRATSDAFGSIVPGSATGDLRGLRGTASYVHDEHGASLTLDYEIDG